MGRESTLAQLTDALCRALAGQRLALQGAHHVELEPEIAVAHAGLGIDGGGALAEELSGPDDRPVHLGDQRAPQVVAGGHQVVEVELDCVIVRGGR